ncbi:MAG TPA: hypothetical protein VMB22_04910 [Verrucomicrobiae bacterium]|nr:hypothetical protein [Verrucomicrobiae bacterium]
MRFSFSNSKTRRAGGMMLIECLVYIAVFAVLLGVGTAAFYEFWDNSNILRHRTDEISAALRAGEMWRADVRGAVGKIEVQTSSGGAQVKIPQHNGALFYRLDSNTLWRATPAANAWVPVLHNVKSSQMETENRAGVQAWRWELELAPFRSRAKTPLEFSFEAVPPEQP